uniref:Metallo-beta-lactamase domain-containing protein n=1 Tax=Pyramimonas obovata TaxID=1411642 RepID=A0A7S0QXV4_9CHLO|mmetsp:Transcript_17361/g.37783  ORF Transcript_17361/g.37783 Transcript_17361/m.37783 type:complete len:439 (+) Transcript_17361:189-1505(+)
MSPLLRQCSVLAISCVLFNVWSVLCICWLLQGMNPVGIRGHTSCDNPVTPGTHILDNYPFACGLQQILPSDKSKGHSEVEVYAYIQPNGSWCWSNAGLIVNKAAQTSVLVDTLTDERLTRNMLSAMAHLLETNPLQTLLHTHADIDHVYGDNLVLNNVSEVLVSEGSAHMLNNLAPPAVYSVLQHLGHALWYLFFEADHTLRPAFMWVMEATVSLPSLRNFLLQSAGAARAIEFFSPFRFDQVTFTRSTLAPELVTVFAPDRTVVSMGGNMVVEVIQTPPAHSEGDTIVVVPSARVAFTGDLLFLGTSPIMWHGPAQNFVAALDLLATLEVDYFVPGHGPITDMKAVQDSREYWIMVQESSAHCLKHSIGYEMCAQEVLRSLPPPFNTWGDQERILVNIWVEMGHLNATKYNTTFKVGPTDKVAQLLRMGCHLVRQHL